jgi:predicted esterase
MSAVKNLHLGQSVSFAGEELGKARAAAILLHGRGATAEDILTLAYELDHPGLAFLAPQAADRTWYPFNLLEPLEKNWEGIRSGFEVIESLLRLLSAKGIEPKRVLIAGFSQGACLALEFAASHARRYGGVAGLSGGLIGPDGTPRDYSGSLEGTPIFLGCSDTDPYIPKERVLETARAMERLGGAVTQRLYPGGEHAVNADEVAFLQELIRLQM